jgi:glycosyltransferase involved in cell wall biosynthesis
MKTIIIPTYNHCADLLTPCLDSLLQYTDLDDIEIIVVANGCTDHTRDYLKDKPVQMLWFDAALGYTKATNEGIKAAKGDVIVLVNNDVVFLPQNKNDWINILCAPLKDGVGITAPLKLYSVATERHFAVFFCAAIQKKMFDKCGLLDEVFSPGSGEDIDFCIKVEQLGYQVLQVPAEVVVKGQVMVGGLPIYHRGEATMLDPEHAPRWHSVVAKNNDLLSLRYKLPEGWFYGPDIEEYRRLALDVPVGGSIGELGCAKGRSLCSIADIIKERKLNVVVVDTFAGTDNEKTPEQRLVKLNYRGAFEESLARFGITATIHQATTTEAAALVPAHALDLLFIDADHSYEAVAQDLSNWEPKVQGVICGHDYGTWPGVTKAVHERYDNVRVGGTIWSKRC